MKIFLIFFLLTLTILFIGKRFFYSARRNLFKDHAAWSGKDILIKHRNPKEIEASKGSDNYLKIIADESKVYLEKESKKEEE